MNSSITVYMDLRLHNKFMDAAEEQGIECAPAENHDGGLNFAEDLLTGATIVGLTSAVLTSIVAIIKRIIPENKSAEIKIGEDIYKFDNYSIDEIEKIIKLTDKQAVIKIIDQDPSALDSKE